MAKYLPSKQNFLVPECKGCGKFPGPDPYKGQYVCSCKLTHFSMPGSWYLCSDCDRRFKDARAQFLCPQCRGVI